MRSYWNPFDEVPDYIGTQKKVKCRELHIQGWGVLGFRAEEEGPLMQRDLKRFRV